MQQTVFCTPNEPHHAAFKHHSQTWQQLSLQQQQQFLWFGIVAPETVFSPLLMARLWQVSPDVATQVLEGFTALALLQRQPAPLPQYLIPQTTYDFAHGLWQRSQSLHSSHPPEALPVPSIPQAHAVVLQQYWAAATEAQWHPIFEDGYIFARLLWHIEHSGRDDILYNLLQETTPSGENVWLSLCDRSDQLDAYVASLAHAQHIVQSLFEHSPQRAIVLQCRSALLQATITHAFQSLSAHWWGALVKAQIWSLSRALTGLDLLAEPSQKAIAIKSLAPVVPASFIPVLWTRIVCMHSEVAQVAGIHAIAPYLNIELLESALTVTSALTDEHRQSQALCALIPYLPDGLTAQALQTTAALQDTTAKADILQQGITTLDTANPAKLHLFYRAVQTLPDPQTQANLLIHLCTKGLDCRPQIRTLLQDIAPSEDRLRLQAAVAPLDPSIAQTLSTTLPSFSKLAPSTQCELIPYLPDADAPLAIKLLEDCVDELDRVSILHALGQRWPQLWHRNLYTFIATLESTDAVVTALALFGPHLPSEDLIALVEQREALETPMAIARLWSTIGPQIPEGGRIVKAAIERIQDASAQLECLISLLPTYPHLCPMAVCIVLELKDEAYQAAQIDRMAPFLSPDQQACLLNLALNMRSPHAATTVMSRLGSSLSPDLLTQAVQQRVTQTTLAKALDNCSKQLTAYALEWSLVPSAETPLTFRNGPPDFISQELLETILAVPDAFQRARVLRTVLHQIDALTLNSHDWQRIVQALSQGNGLDFVESLPLLAPSILKLGGTETLQEIAKICRRQGASEHPLAGRVISQVEGQPHTPLNPDMPPLGSPPPC